MPLGPDVALRPGSDRTETDRRVRAVDLLCAHDWVTFDGVVRSVVTVSAHGNVTVRIGPATTTPADTPGTIDPAVTSPSADPVTTLGPGTPEAPRDATTVPPGAPDIAAAIRRAASLLGTYETDVGDDVRIADRGAEEFALTMDLVPGRLNVGVVCFQRAVRSRSGPTTPGAPAVRPGHRMAGCV